MVNLQHQPTTDRSTAMLQDEEDERERVLLVVVGSAGAAKNYAISVALVREVVRSRAVTRVPGSPLAMRGLVNVRGMVVTVLELATCIGVASELPASVASAEMTPESGHASHVTEARAQMPGSIVLMEHGGRLVGLAVDRVRDVRPLDDVGLVVDPSTSDTSNQLIRGLASAGGEVVTLLDVAALLSRHLISSAET